MTPEVVFETVHGSRLYGFAHAGSDFDTFTVTTSRAFKTRQTITTDGADRVVVGLWHFLDLATSGSHQSVEALFSPVKEWGPAAVPYRPMLQSIRIGGGDVFEKYERTIRKFCFADFKRRRHAARLAQNLHELRSTGVIKNVTLAAGQIAWCGRVAEQYEGDDLAIILNVRRNDG